MPKILILSNAYLLPELPDALRELPSSGQKRSQIVESGEAPEASILGLLTLSARHLSVEGRFQRLEELVREYQAAIASQETYRHEYRRFFSELGRGVRSTVASRTAQIRELDRKSRYLADLAGRGGDQALLARARELRERLVRLVRRIGQATLLLLSQADQCNSMLAAAARHQQRQEELLNKLGGRLRSHQEMHQLEQEVAQFEGKQDSAPRQAREFVGYRHEYFDPLREVAEQVIELDGQLFTAVEEIERLSRFLEPDSVGEPPALGAGQALLDLLVGARLSRQRVAEEVGRASICEPGEVSLPAADASREAALEDALNNISDFLVLRFEGGFGAEILERARRQNTPEAWQAYVAEYPDGLGMEEARRALNLPGPSGAADSRAAAPDQAPKTAAGQGDDAEAARAFIAQLSVTPQNGIRLANLQPASVQVGEGELQINRGWCAQDTAVVAGQPCRDFLGIHAPAKLVYEIPQGAKRFTAVGARIDHPAAAHGTWKYKVSLDGKIALESPPLHQQPDGIPIDVSIHLGARELMIEVDDFGDKTADYAVLAYPCFHRPDSH